MANATEKQIRYLSDLVQVEMVNKVTSRRGLTGDQCRKLNAECVRLIRAEIEAGLDVARASALIDAAKVYCEGPQPMLAALGFTHDKLKALLA